MGNFLTKSQRKELLDDLSLEGNRRYADRIRTVLLVDSGETMVDIARFLFLDEGTVRNWRKRYEEGGIEKLLNDHYVGRVSLLDEQQKGKLVDELSAQVFATTKDVVRWRRRATVWCQIYDWWHDELAAQTRIFL